MQSECQVEIAGKVLDSALENAYVSELELLSTVKNLLQGLSLHVQAGNPYFWKEIGQEQREVASPSPEVYYVKIATHLL